MEGLGIRMFGGAYRDRRVLLTGHTGFKGSWLALWLTNLGARLTGVALPPPTDPNHWDLLDLELTDWRTDIREFGALARIVAEAQPEIVFHLAAQPLVRRSYRDPLETWSTNVLGTVNLLEACRLTPGVRAIVVITTDKCYQNHEWVWGYRENDQLGGHDPYSASKAGAELVAASYQSAFFDSADAPLVATARAGNVIGGGDWSEDRLIPDLVRTLATSTPLAIRFPQATRPWQHVLESLSGYLLLGQKLLEGQRELAGAWNFGPYPRDNRTVGEILNRLCDYWPMLDWVVTPVPQLHEANLLYLDSTKARQLLGWRPAWELEDGLRATAVWYQHFLDSGVACSHEQLDQYLVAALAAELPWRRS